MIRGRVAATVTVLLAAAHSAAVAETPMTVDQANVVAQAIDLSATDMPGYDVMSLNDFGSGGDAPAADDPFDDCTSGNIREHVLADAASDEFTRETRASGQGIQLEVVVLDSPELAQQDVTAAGSRRVRKCLTRTFRKTGPRHAKIAVVKLASPVPNGAGIRIEIRARIRKVPVTAFVDVLVAARGPVEIGLVTSSAPHRIRPQTEAGLMSLLVGRAETALAAAPRSLEPVPTTRAL